jgi:serine/threonine protein kinase
MEYLHANNICHGDLKADNVLLHFSGPLPKLQGARASATAAAGDDGTSSEGTQGQGCGSERTLSGAEVGSEALDPSPVDVALQLCAKVADFGLSR